MPACLVCESQSFDVLDGLYFCTQCGTQSQDIREELDARDELLNSRLIVRKGKKKSKKEQDLGKPWFTLEGFQIIIKAQIEYLVKMGVDPKLKDIVKQMWFRYIQLSTDVFKGSVDEPRSYCEIKKKRDNTKDFIPFDSIPRPVPKYLTGCKPDDDALELSSEIAREDFYDGIFRSESKQKKLLREGEDMQNILREIAVKMVTSNMASLGKIDDDPTAGLFANDNDSDENSEGDHDDDSSCVGSIYLKVHKTRDSLLFMSLAHTLAFCYLGLLWLKEPICLSDLVRWARNGHLPYLNASSYFPSHMKFASVDLKTFCSVCVPSKARIYSKAVKLKNFLSLPELPKHNVQLYIARYLVDLQLPASIHRFVNIVVKLAGTDHGEPLLNYDDLSMAFIVLSLKLIYGLDGTTEHDLEKLVKENPPDEYSRFPSWGDVLECIYSCQKGLVEHSVPWTKQEFSLIKDSRNYSQFCRETIFGSWEPPAIVQRHKISLKGFKGLNSEKQEEYGDMFDMFLSKSGMVEGPSNAQTATSFPLLCGKKSWLRNRRVGHNQSSSSRTANDPFKRLERRRLNQEALFNCYEKARFPVYDFPTFTLNSHLSTAVQCSRFWKNVVLPDSLRHIIELCSKILEMEPSVFFVSVQRLEQRLFDVIRR